MKSAYSMMREGIKSFPSSLLHLPPKLRNIAAKSLPFSVGIEIECKRKEDNTYPSEHLFRYFMHKEMAKLSEEMSICDCFIDRDFTRHEQKFRVKPGINGLIGIDLACKFLQKYFIFNCLSGNHYHIDMSDCFFTDIENNQHLFCYNPGAYKKLIPNPVIGSVLESLSSWNYKGGYNAKGIQYEDKSWWATYRSEYKTLEIRIGEMTFDYSIMSKRAIQGCEIVKKIKTLM